MFTSVANRVGGGLCARRALGWTFYLPLTLALLACSASTSKTIKEKTIIENDPPPQPYIIGKDDVLDVSVWKEPQLSGMVTVGADGTITVPLAGQIRAAGRTCKEVQEELRNRLAKFTREPNVTVRVANPRSQVFYVLGEVRKPGAFQLHSGEVLSQGIAEAGGFTEFANTRAIRLVRRSGNETAVMTINFKRIQKGEDLAGDIPLQAGDTITVP